MCVGAVIAIVLCASPPGWAQEEGTEILVECEGPCQLEEIVFGFGDENPESDAPPVPVINNNEPVAETSPAPAPQPAATVAEDEGSGRVFRPTLGVGGMGGNYQDGIAGVFGSISFQFWFVDRFAIEVGGQPGVARWREQTLYATSYFALALVDVDVMDIGAGYMGSHFNSDTEDPLNGQFGRLDFRFNLTENWQLVASGHAGSVPASEEVTDEFGLPAYDATDGFGGGGSVSVIFKF